MRLTALSLASASAGSFFISSGGRYLAGCGERTNERRNCLGRRSGSMHNSSISQCLPSVSQSESERGCLLRCRLVGRGSGSRWARLMNIWVRSSSLYVCTVRIDSLPHRKWKENKQQPGTAGPGNMFGCSLVSFHFLWGKLSTRTVQVYMWVFFAFVYILQLT